jgi:hypothetical protein
MRPAIKITTMGGVHWLAGNYCVQCSEQESYFFKSKRKDKSPNSGHRFLFQVWQEPT